jgi:sugar O-acyltransferase (sialic acid O-acetyltransferase NeuD family)
LGVRITGWVGRKIRARRREPPARHLYISTPLFVIVLRRRARRQSARITNVLAGSNFPTFRQEGLETWTQNNLMLGAGNSASNISLKHFVCGIEIAKRIMNEPRTKLIILGTRAFAEEVADLVSDCDEYRLVGFGENWERERCSATLLDQPIIWIDDLRPFAEDHQVVCAIGTVQRSFFIKQVESLGFRFATIRHPGARVSKTSTIGTGTIVSVGVVVAAQTRVGRYVILNRGCLIGHHTTIGDYVTISPGANIAGRVTIGEKTFVGIGATILEDIEIGHHAIIGAGSVVTKDVPDNVQVVGAPAQITKENVQGR